MLWEKLKSHLQENQEEKIITFLHDGASQNKRSGGKSFLLHSPICENRSSYFQSAVLLISFNGNFISTIFFSFFSLDVVVLRSENLPSLTNALHCVVLREYCHVTYCTLIYLWFLPLSCSASLFFCAIILVVADLPMRGDIMDF